ncbi:peptidase S8/S53 domain-containing protein [Neurospora tetraspora]|uniref:Peptidase S8/S53 domain-containing protein n=1 Tax=Neurospora tetraspora TaxID=94610 RepID=A0AAE0MRZ0_9PEZI|nr:peptidase S8/S53 domain-containing protein [Neurospora tetraspora]
MRLSSFLLPLLAVGGEALKKYIIEVDQGVDLDDLANKFSVSAGGRSVIRRFDKTSDVFFGLCVETDDMNIDDLPNFPGILRAWPVGRATLHAARAASPVGNIVSDGNYSVHSLTGVDKLHAKGIYGKGAKVAVVDTGIDYKHHAVRSFLSLSAFPEINNGSSVEDSGMDSKSPVAPILLEITVSTKMAMLRKRGYNTTNRGLAWPFPDDDPFDYQGHGTQVAGVIAGKTDWFNGVAPEATLYSYKVFSNDSQVTDEDIIIDAFLQAYKDGADIITSSIGGEGGWSGGAWATIASRLVDRGVLVTISAGNEGYKGPFLASSGSSGKNVIAVASTEPSVAPAWPFKATFTHGGNSTTIQLGYLIDDLFDQPWGQDLTDDLPIIPLSLNVNDTADACEPLPEHTPDLSAGILLIRWGGCDSSVKQENAEKAGAKRVLFYSDDAGPVWWLSVTSNPPAALIEAKTGEAMVATVAAGGKVTAKFAVTNDTTWRVGFYSSAGGIPSGFSSWGGTNELEIKPDVAAPGGNIYTTDINEPWTFQSGTSMACAYVAGIAALYIGEHGGRSVHGPGIAKALANRIISSGAAVPWQVDNPVGNPIDYGFWAPVPQVGTGLVNAAKVLDYTTSLTWEKFHLNDTANFQAHHSVTITNNGPKSATYSFALQPAGAFNAQSDYDPEYLSTFTDYISPYPLVPRVQLPQNVTIAPGHSKTVHIKFQPPSPTSYNATKLPIYSGKVLINSNENEDLSIPYYGAAFSLRFAFKDHMFIYGPFQAAGPDREDIDTYHTYDFNLSLAAQSYPTVAVDLRFPTKTLRWDIFEADWTEAQWNASAPYPPTGDNGYVGSVAFWSYSDLVWRFDPDNRDLPGYWDTISFPLTVGSGLNRGNARDRFSTWFMWFGKLVGGSYIRPGKYRFRFAAQIPFTDPSHSDSWDVWKTPVITILDYDRHI